MPQFTNEGLKLRYVVHGKGAPVVLLHGGTVSFERNFAMFGWNETLNARGFQVSGGSDHGSGPSGPEPWRAATACPKPACD